MVESIWRYPLKSGQGEAVPRVFIGAGGRNRRGGRRPVRWLGERVHLTTEVPAQARLHRLWPEEPGMMPEWAAGAGAGGEDITTVSGAAPGGRFPATGSASAPR